MRMHRTLSFLRMTMTGGILFLLPVVVLVALVGKAVSIVDSVIAPIAQRLPIESAIGLETPKILAFFIVVLLCFLSGLFARTVAAQRLVTGLESGLLVNLPGYAFYKAVGRNLLGERNDDRHQPALVRIADAWQFAFIIEKLEEDGHSVMFIPSAGSPSSGSIFIMSEDRIHRLNIPPMSIMKCMRTHGKGSAALISGAAFR